MWDSPTGLSSRAIAGDGNHHPWDPSDLRRCMNYCARTGITTERLRARMAGLSNEWDRLLPEWDCLTTILQLEMDTRTDGTAPLTYREMKRVLANADECTACASTGRGIDCTKCKGTGHRSGGRCRARHCYRGADYCQTCKGRGYIPKEES